MDLVPIAGCCCTGMTNPTPQVRVIQQITLFTNYFWHGLATKSLSQVKYIFHSKTMVSFQSSSPYCCLGGYKIYTSVTAALDVASVIFLIGRTQLIYFVSFSMVITQLLTRPWKIRNFKEVTVSDILFTFFELFLIL